MNNNNTSWTISILKKKKLLIAGGLLAALVLALAFWLIAARQPQPERISLSKLAQDIRAGDVVKLEDKVLTGEFTAYYKDGETRTGSSDNQTSLLEQLNLLGLKPQQLAATQIEIVKGGSPIAGNPLAVVLGLALFGVSAVSISKLAKKESLIKSKFQQKEIPLTRFTDVAAIEENLDELRDVLSFLRNGNSYKSVGAKMPHGVLMVGDPGTGKTLVARALAGEAGVPFFATSGSEFVEMYVGVGASRIRSLFKKARKKSPCIVFIDEIDAIGRARHRSETGAEMEQDQALNQLLVEMDGFDGAEGVVVLAATNRVDVLDPALTRAGRFDRRIHFHPPDVKGREAILAVHLEGKTLADDVNLADLAKATPGLVGADLANLVNEAAILAVRNEHEAIQRADLEDAIEKVLTGSIQRKSHVISEDERQIIAYHEAGHAIVMHETRPDDPIYKISIIPRGQMGGFTMALPEKDRILVSRRKMFGIITGVLGGRAAEEIFFRDITNGASNDLKVATEYAEEMVLRLGMDERAGLRVFNPINVRSGSTPNAQKTFETIDGAINTILDECYSEAKRILEEKRDYVDRVAEELLEVETISKERFAEIMAA